MLNLKRYLGLSALLLVIAGCGIETPKVVALSNPPVEEHSEKPTDLTIFYPKVDILFVIDSSGSMGSVQTSLSNNVAVFAREIAKMSVLDYHIAVTTTDMDYCHRQDACGRLSGTPAWVDKNTVNIESELAARMIVGINGTASEVMFTPVVSALSPPLDTSANAGFYRPDAFLAVIFITDADDQSRLSPQETYQFLTQKKGDVNKVLGYGVIRTMKTAQTCSAPEDVKGRLDTFLGLVVNSDANQKNILNLCSQDYGLKLVDFAKDIVSRSAGKVALTRLPNPATIRVFYGTQEIPNDFAKGWVYENSTNSIIFSEKIEWDRTQGPTASIRIDFEPINP